MVVTTRKNNIALSLGRIVFVWLTVCAFADDAYAQQDSTRVDRDTTTNQPYRPNRRPVFRPTDRYGDPFSNITNQTPLFLKDPNLLKLDVEIDTGMNYTIFEKIGDVNYRPTSEMTFEEFKQYQERQQLKEYWQTRSRAADGESAVNGRGFIPKIFVSPVLDRIFGGSYVELIPRGFVTLDFGGSWQKINNPAIPIRQQRNGGFEFDQQINMSVVGKIGEKLAVTANFDNNNSFDFQNNMKVEYTGFKEDILKKLEIGNVSLPLNNTLIQGAQNLFGVKAQMQFGKLMVTSIASTQRGKASSIDIQGGGTGQGRPFEIIASNYDENRHFFLGQFFRDNYRSWIRNLPQITSGINITRIEVYILNRNNDTQTLRNVVGLLDLGEGKRVYNPSITGLVPTLPNSNNANDLKQVLSFDRANRNPDNIASILASNLPFGSALENGTDFEKITGARKLSPTEFTYHRQLGYITLTRKLQNDEALAVAYEYTYNGQVYKVGELSEDYSNLKDDEVIFLKLLRQRNLSTVLKTPAWDLMMKNIYNLNVNGLSQEGFQLRIIYRDDRTGIDNPQLQEGGTQVSNHQLIEVLGLDRLNPVNDPQPDGNFDFVPGITINQETGLIIFPYLEPFNTALRESFAQEEPTVEERLVNKYVYDRLYRTTKAEAELLSTKNKFYLIGQYNAGSSKEIIIPGFGVSPGSVRVYAGGIPLQEGSQFTVDYTFGKVTILDQSILNSGKNISIQYEQADPFAFQTRTLIGSRFDYRLSEDVNFGSTFLYYNERPLISRNLIGTEPARNIQYGLDLNVNKRSRVLTKLVDAIPLIQTKEPSTINFSGEFAQLIPGTSNVINGEGTGYVDDFENTATPYSLLSPQGWKLASIPKTIEFDDTQGALNDLQAGYRRAKIAWYQVDNQFYRPNGQFQPTLNDADLKNHYMRAVGPQEIFPLRQLNQAVFFEPILDIAYYPYERGMFNYNPNLDNSGFLPNPAQNWAGITSAVRTEVDFDKANIEYVEFWLLDPFINGENGQIRDGIFNKSNTTGGRLIFQLGSVSEDIMRDGKHAFENGLPPDGDFGSGGVTENPWGYVTTQQYLTNAFDNQPSSRANQDVGLDGASNERELQKYQDFVNAIASLPPDVQQSLREDISADNYRYFLGSDFDQRKASILERYKNVNGMEGNSPIANTTVSQGTNVPDNEDLNQDNTLSELEEYYEYDIDLKPGQLGIGSEYVVDKIDAKPTNVQGDVVTWYLFRIPVRQFERQVGDIRGFKSIRYVRMLLTGFKEPVVLRLANFRMVGSRWRRYEQPLLESGLTETPEQILENFTVSVVNLEENAQSDNNKSGYVIPPGVVRDRDNTSTVNRQLNEQSVQLCIDELNDGDARAIYKITDADFFNYGRIKMYLHANSEAQDDELHAFLRLGSDFDQNYYEIEIPLKITNPANTNVPREVWPEENEIDLVLDELYALKAARDREKFSLNELYPREGPKQVGRHLIRIFGRPDLSSVKTMMIGVRNPRSPDKRSHSVCIWANELRVTDFNRTPGWAVNGAMSAKLADFATVNGAFRHTTFGFGSVSSKIGERTRSETTAYDVSATVNIDKLLPGNHGIKVPMFISYQNTTINPKYDPANPDLKIDAALKSFNTDEERSDYLKLIRDQETRRSLNFTNVRKTKVKADAPVHLWDIENFSFSYSYSESKHSNFNIKESLQQAYRGSINYNFAPKATGIEPFKKSKGLKSPYLQLIKDFNIGLLPSNLAVRLDLDRTFGKNVYRNESGAQAPNYLKYFLFNRAYNLRWPLTKSLTFEYTATANAVIDEPAGEINTKENRDSVWTSLQHFGRMKLYNQTATVNYKLPLDKIPLTNWIDDVNYRYSAGYNWKAGPINQPDSLNFGNIIQNTRDQNVTGTINLVKLYNKVKFLKEINTPPRPQPTTRPNTTRPQTQQQPQQKQPVDTVKQTPPLIKGLARLIMSLRSINGTYTLTEGTMLPGFNKSPYLVGMDQDFNAPGWNFIFGDQDPNIRFKAADKGWLVNSADLTNPFVQIQNKTINIRANIEPATDLKIQVDFKKNVSSSYQEIFRFDEGSDAYQSLNPSRSGSYEVSSLAIRTAFNKSNDAIQSEIFNKFEQNLEIVRNRFSPITGVEYDSATQDVLIPAFISAYTGQDVNSVSLSPFPRTPMPNWNVTYSGLTKLGGLKDVFQSVTISHAYVSSYKVLNYSNSLQYSDPEKVGIDRPVEDYNERYFGQEVDGALVPVYVISQVLISEKFAPLIGISVRTKGRLTATLQYKTSRDVALNVSNAQVTELNNKDVSFDLGFTKNNMKLPFKSQGRTIVLKNDVTFKLNVTVTDSKTIQRKIDERNIITNGNVNFQLRPNITYQVNQKLSLQGYFERTINEPVVSNSYRRATTRFGIQVRFSLAQ